MMRTDFLKKRMNQYRDFKDLSVGRELSGKLRREIADYLEEASAILEAGGYTRAFPEGNIEVCRGCGMPAAGGCGEQCRVMEFGLKREEVLDILIRSKE